MGRSYRQKISRKTLDLNDTLDQKDLTDYINILSKNREHILKHNWDISPGKDHMLEAIKQILVSLKKLKSSIFSDHNGLKLEIRYKKIGKSANG